MRLSLSTARAALPALGMAVVLACIMAVPAAAVLEGWLAERQTWKAWTIEGPPCPTSPTPVTQMASRRPPKAFTYGGAAFTRLYNSVSCVSIPAGPGASERFARVCQFNAPVAVTVETGATTTTYRTGPRPVTIKVVDGRASCVLAGWFEG